MKRRVRQARSAVLRTCGVLMRFRPGQDRDWRQLARAWLLEAATRAGSERSQILALHLLEAGREGCVFAPCAACGEQLVPLLQVDQGLCTRHTPGAVTGPEWALARYSASALAFAATLEPGDFDAEVREDVRRCLLELEERLQRVKDAGEAEEAT